MSEPYANPDPHHKSTSDVGLEFPVSDEIKRMGIKRLYVKSGTFFVDNCRPQPIICSYTGDLKTTSNALEQALIDTNEFDERAITKITMHLADVWYEQVKEKEKESHSRNNDNNQTIKPELELTPELKQEGIVDAYYFDPEINGFSIELNDKYGNKKIISQIEPTWHATIEELTRISERKKISPEHITMLCDVADNAASEILRFLKKMRTERQKKAKAEDTQNKKLLNLVRERCEKVFVNQYNEPYAAVQINGHMENLKLDSTRFKNWMCKACYEREGFMPSSEEMGSVLNVLKASAEFDGNSKELHLRVAYPIEELIEREDKESNANAEGKEAEEMDKGGNVYLHRTIRTIRTIIFYDLTNKAWEAIKVTPEGWTIEKPPIMFRRYNTRPQVYPSRNYSKDIFDKFVTELLISKTKKESY